MKTLVVANQKGGVAKTTTAVNLAAYLGSLGKRVVLVDLDPQANATSGVGLDRNLVDKSVYDLLIGREDIAAVLKESPTHNVSIIPASLSLVGAEIELVSADRREHRLGDDLTKNDFKNQYDFVIIDTPPSLGLLTLNAMTAANSVLIPMQCEYYALEGLAQLYKTIQLVRKSTNPGLYIEGLLFSMVDQRSNLTVQVMNEVKKILKDKVYETVIPRNIRLAEAPSFGKPILTYDKSSKGAEAYEKLANEFLARSSPAEPVPAPTPAAEPEVHPTQDQQPILVPATPDNEREVSS
jgi:chromosome partitioning protein